MLGDSSVTSRVRASFKSYKGELPFYIDQCNINSQTALYLACAAGHTEVVEELLDYQPLNSGSLPLLPSGNPKAVIKLDTYTVEGKTPLHCAVLCGYVEIVSVLLRHGADVNKPLKSLRELMRQVPEEGYQNMKFREAVHIAPTDTSVLYAAFQRSDTNLEIIKLLLSYGAKDVDGKVLLSANLSRNKEVVSLLLAYMGVHRDQDSSINEVYREKFKHLLLPMVSVKAGKQASGGTLGKSLKRRRSLSDKQKASMLRRRRTLASIKRPAVIHSSFDTPVAINWHDHNLTDIYKEWLVEASLRFNPALKHLENICNCIHDKISVITKLDISDNCLRKVPLIIFQLPSLQTLNLSNNKLIHLPVGSLESISEHEDEEAPIVGWKLPYLKELKLDGNRLSSVPIDVFKLPSLEMLTLVNNALEELPYDMWRAPSLKVLNVSKNKLKELPTSLADNDDVFSLDAEASVDTVRMDYSLANVGGHSDSGSESDYLAMDEREHYVEMHNTSAVTTRDREDVVKSQLGSVSFGNLKRHKLCSSGSVVSLPVEETPSSEEICKLKELDLSHNQFEAVPPGLACLAPQLVKLVMSYNEIKICGPINHFPAGLVDLYMSHNQVSQITNLLRKVSCNQKSSKFMLFRGVHHNEESSSRTDLCYSPFLIPSATPSIASKHISQDSSSILPASPKSNQAGKSYYCQHQRHRVLANLLTLELSHNQLPSLNITTTNSSSSPPSSVESKDDAEGEPTSSQVKVGSPSLFLSVICLSVLIVCLNCWLSASSFVCLCMSFCLQIHQKQ